MIAIDTNLLVYAHRGDSEWHQKAVSVLTELAEGSRSWGIPWPCVHEFLAVVTHPRIYSPPTPMNCALQAIRVWMESPSCRMLGEGPSYLEALEPLLLKGKAVGPKVHDARIAALCVDNGVNELWTADRDFSRFPTVKTRNPVI